jgi:glycosyltransferase involved in cell wall biosynthesis
MSTIMIPYGYGMNFNVPRTMANRHRRTRYAPLYRAWRPLESVAIYWPFVKGDVLHTMNAIPLMSTKPWVVTFESRLPRLFEKGRFLRNTLRNRLLDRDCLAILPMSEWALRQFRYCNRDWAKLADAETKVRLLHPSVPSRSREVRTFRRGDKLRLLFVGNQFARKGGVVALRVARSAAAEGLPVELEIISAMHYGAGNHCDHPDRAAYAEDMKLLETLANVRFLGKQPNDIVLDRMMNAHFTFLASLHETYGFSVIEGFSCATPAFTANTCAQGEINGADRGITLRLPVDDLNCWVGLRQGSPPYWAMLNATYDDLACQALAAVRGIIDHPESVERLSSGAIAAAETTHSPEDAAAILEEIYANACSP